MGLGNMGIGGKGISFEGISSSSTAGMGISDNGGVLPRNIPTFSGTEYGDMSRNLLTHPEEFDNAAWSKSNTTITPNVTAAPDGTLTADEIEHTDSFAGLSQIKTVVADVSHT